MRSEDAAGASGATGLVTKFSPPGIGEAPRRITCVAYRPDGEELLASYSSDYIYVFDPRDSVEDGGTKTRLGPGPGEKSPQSASPQPVKKLRLRGDWSDTGPNSRPEMLSERVPPSERESGVDRGLHTTLMQRMTDALSRMLNDPGTRMAMQRLHRGEEEEEENNRETVGRSSEEGEQGRAASAIQERWRRYRRRRLEEALRQERQIGEEEPEVEEDSEEDQDETVEERESDPIVVEDSEELDRCSPSSFCCLRCLRRNIPKVKFVLKN